jgi:hypothetical protein
MLTRRDVATFAWYCLLFSAVVCWAAFRHGGSGSVPRGASTLDHEVDPLGESDQNAVLRRAVGHMVTQ